MDNSDNELRFSLVMLIKINYPESVNLNKLVFKQLKHTAIKTEPIICLTYKSALLTY